MDTEKKKSNILVDFLLSFIYIPFYSLKGIKFLLWDMWVILFNFFAWNLEKAVGSKK